MPGVASGRWPAPSRADILLCGSYVCCQLRGHLPSFVQPFLKSLLFDIHGRKRHPAVHRVLELRITLVLRFDHVDR